MRPEIRIIESSAAFSPCRTYRYALRRVWDNGKEPCAFLCLNPSTADENLDDPTVRRVIRYAYDWGFGSVFMLNIFAYRSTDPMKLLTVDDPIGPENDATILEIAGLCKLVVAGWGNHGRLLARGERVFQMFRENGLTLQCLKVNDRVPEAPIRHPTHPLYMRGDLRPITYFP